MYESPFFIIDDVDLLQPGEKSVFDIVAEEYGKKIEEYGKKFDECVMKAVCNVGIQVDKAELEKALKYDRGQYDKGYADGYVVGYRDGYNCGTDEQEETDDEPENIAHLPTPEEMKETYTDDETDMSFLMYENDSVDSPFLHLVVKAMKEFGKVNDLDVFELYMALGTQILLSEGLLNLDFGDDDA